MSNARGLAIDSANQVLFIAGMIFARTGCLYYELVSICIDTRALYMHCDFIIDFLQTTITIVFVCFACLTESFCGNSVDRAMQPENSHIAGLWYSTPVSDSCLYRYRGRGRIILLVCGTYSTLVSDSCLYRYMGWGGIILLVCGTRHPSRTVVCIGIGGGVGMWYVCIIAILHV